MAGIKKHIGRCAHCQTQCDAVGLECRDKVLYVRKPIPLCLYHYTNLQHAKRQKKNIENIAKQVFKANSIPPSKSRGGIKKKPRKKTEEAAMFKEIWEEREHICINCKAYLGEEPIVHYFSHRKGKGANPELRLDKTNIDLLCRDCHYARDFQGEDKFKKRTR